MTERNAQAELQSMVDRIAYTMQNGSDELNEDGEPRSGFDFLTDALDIEYRVDGKGEYRSAKILVTFGGPNVWIDTNTKKVIGAWWGTYAEAEYSHDEMGVDDACEELWSCR